ncbi:hypothetical protein AEQ27_04025 [Frigoribacterium sp. RIT-PI-h]|nr:hypothetical protein AEQ27_04025 [Frigoribacterium sp. RIT-PI-h]
MHLAGGFSVVLCVPAGRSRSVHDGRIRWVCVCGAPISAFRRRCMTDEVAVWLRSFDGECC